jgi:ribonuclease HI
VRVARALFDDPSSSPLHPDFLCHRDGAESTTLPWGRAVTAELLAVDALGTDAGLVRARIDGALVALAWVQLPAGWRLRFASLS